MTIIKIGISSAAAASGLAEYNDVQITAGTVSADLHDVSELSTGISLASDANLSDSATNNNVTGDVAPFVKAVLDYYQFVNAAVTLTFSGFSPNEPVKISFIGHSSTQSTRDVNLTTNGNTYLYDVSGTTTPTDALVYTENADGSGDLAILFESTVANNVYFSASQLEFGDLGPSITSATDPIVDQSTVNVVTDGLTGTPSGTLDGVAVSLSGSFPNLSFTPDVFGITSEQSAPRVGQTVELAITGTEGTATVNRTIDPPAGHAVVELTSTDKTAGGFIDTIETETGKTIAIGNSFYYEEVGGSDPNAGGTVIDDSGVLQTSATSLKVILFQGNVATDLNVTFEEVGSGSDRKLTFSKMKGVKLTFHKLKASKL